MSGDGPTLPSSFGRYLLLERLAVGGMAEIFKAKITGAHGFEKTVVIKRILPHLAADPSFVQMFINEAKVTVELVHPKIVQVFEFGDVEGQLYIALEYVEGLDALALLRACAHRRLRLPARLAVHIAAEVLDALDYAHRAVSSAGDHLGVIHRDISPSNLFLSRRGDVKLGDFGIARVTERHSKTQAGTLKGKYGYMSPEQVVGGEMDGRSDVFSVGIVLAEMLMGRRLFVAAGDLDVLLMVRDARLDRLKRYGKDIEPELRALVVRALQRNVEDRYAHAGEFRDALLDWLLNARMRVRAADVAAFLKTLRVPLGGSVVAIRDKEAAVKGAAAKAAPAPGQPRSADAGREAGTEPAAAGTAAAEEPSIAEVTPSMEVEVESLPDGTPALEEADTGVMGPAVAADRADAPVAEVEGEAAAGDEEAVTGEAAAGDEEAVAGEAATGDEEAVAGEAAAGDEEAVAGEAVAGGDEAVAGEAVAGGDEAVLGEVTPGAEGEIVGAERGTPTAEDHVPAAVAKEADRTVPLRPETSGRREARAAASAERALTPGEGVEEAFAAAVEATPSAGLEEAFAAATAPESGVEEKTPSTGDEEGFAGAAAPRSSVEEAFAEAAEATPDSDTSWPTLTPTSGSGPKAPMGGDTARVPVRETQPPGQELEPLPTPPPRAPSGENIDDAIKHALAGKLELADLGEANLGELPYVAPPASVPSLPPEPSPSLVQDDFDIDIPIVEATPAPLSQDEQGAFIDLGEGLETGDGSSAPSVEPAPPPPVGVEPPVTGNLERTTPVKLFSRLAIARETGLVVVECGGVRKEIFIVNGSPEYVTSNVARELLGEYLVAQGVISAGEQSMALAMMPRFGGRLGDTLVGLGLMRPLEVFRHLTRQVRAKLVDIYAWRKGTYSYERGKTNNREAFPLGLDAFEIIGAGVVTIALDHLRQRFAPQRRAQPRALPSPPVAPEAFRLGPGPRELYNRLDGRRRLADWEALFTGDEELVNFYRTLYLLVETGLAEL